MTDRVPCPEKIVQHQQYGHIWEGSCRFSYSVGNLTTVREHRVFHLFQQAGLPSVAYREARLS